MRENDELVISPEKFKNLHNRNDKDEDDDDINGREYKRRRARRNAARKKNLAHFTRTENQNRRPPSPLQREGNVRTRSFGFHFANRKRRED